MTDILAHALSSTPKRKRSDMPSEDIAGANKPKKVASHAGDCMQKSVAKLEGYTPTH